MITTPENSNAPVRRKTNPYPPPPLLAPSSNDFDSIQTPPTAEKIDQVTINCDHLHSLFPHHGLRVGDSYNVVFECSKMSRRVYECHS